MWMRIVIIILVLIIGGCEKNEKKVEQQNEPIEGNDLGGTTEQEYPDFIPEEVRTKADSIRDELEDKSGFHFVRRRATNYVDGDVGASYSIYYWVTSFNSISLSHGSRFMHLRMLFDTYSNKLSAICIILEFENPTQEYYELYYNYLYPAFLEFNFDELFEGRRYKKTEKSDDENHSQNKFYTEYILDLS